MQRLLFITAIGLAAFIFIVRPLRRRIKRRALMGSALEPRLKALAWRNVPMASRLPIILQEELEGLVNVFLAEKKFTGFNGLTVTDEMRATIAAQACLLLLGRRTSYYKHLVNIYLYPDSFSSVAVKGAHGVKSTKRTVRLGESWTYGPVVLSWEDAREGGLFPHDGRNVVYHEFAHQLDQEDGHGDGVPTLGKLSHYGAWARVVEREYLALVEAERKGKDSFLDQYGATNPAEFFAVVTEAFFEQPIALKEKHAALYEQMVLFYHLDMANLAPEQS